MSVPSSTCAQSTDTGAARTRMACTRIRTWTTTTTTTGGAPAA